MTHFRAGYFRIFVVIVMTIGFFSPRAHAQADCACVGTTRSACEVGWNPNVTAVFRGKVVARDGGELGHVDAVEFEVKEVFRGHLQGTVTLHVHTHFCGPWIVADPFEVGKEYIVYASGESDAHLNLGSDAELVMDNSGAVANSCTSRAVSIDDAEDDLYYWRNLSEVPSTSRIFGSLKAYIRERMFDDPFEDSAYEMRPYSGEWVTAKGLNGEFRAQTGRDGRFEITGLPPGTYEVTPEAGEALHLRAENTTVQVGPKACAQVDFRNSDALVEMERKLELAHRKRTEAKSAK